MTWLDHVTAVDSADDQQNSLTGSPVCNKQLRMPSQWISIVFLSFLNLLNLPTNCSAVRSFHIDFENDTFVKDGKPFRYISGSIHYARVPKEYWEDRLQKMAASGLNAIQVYIPWNLHEPEPGVYNMTGQNDLIGFIQLADKLNLLVILRPGPYICAEWEYGGFPYWLKKYNDSIVLRSSDPGYIKPVTRWFSFLLPKMEPLLYVNGGPIIMVQVENEYGSYGGEDCDHDYMAYLRDMLHRYLGYGVQLFTLDGAGEGYLKCGSIKGAYATVDFGPGDAKAGFAPMRAWNPKGPLVNSEYYTGWLDYWNTTWVYTSTERVIKTLKQILDMGASVNMYMFEGGTNFGYMNGADPTYKPVVTSYDYDAPMTEAGDTTHKYMAIRDLIKQYQPVPSQVPPNTTKAAYGTITMNKLTTIGQVSDLEPLTTHPPIISTYPVTMETAGQAYGFCLYHTVLGQNFSISTLDLSGVRDRGYVTLDGVLQGMVYRNAQTSLQMAARAGQGLDILVENMGRTNYGLGINENKKGIISNVTFGGITLTSWQYYEVDLANIPQDSLTKLRFGSQKNIAKADSDGGAPAVYVGSFTIPEHQAPADTYLNMCGWNKGVALLNRFNLGRYWPVLGPQVTLYVPKTIVKPYPEINTLFLFELEPGACSHGNRIKDYNNQCSVKFQKNPILGAKCSNEGKITRWRDGKASYNDLLMRKRSVTYS